MIKIQLNYKINIVINNQPCYNILKQTKKERVKMNIPYGVCACLYSGIIREIQFLKSQIQNNQELNEIEEEFATLEEIINKL